MKNGVRKSTDVNSFKVWSPSFIFSLLYLIIEYMRPQEMYEFLKGIPFADIIISLIFLSLLIEKRKFLIIHTRGMLLFFFLIIHLISYIFAINTDLALSGLIDMGKWILIYFLLINVLDNEKKLYIFLTIFLLIVFKYAQHAIRIWIQNGFYVDPRGLYEGAGFASGFFKNPNDFGVLLNIAFGLSFYVFITDDKRFINFGLKIFYLLMLIILPLAILTTSSRGSTFTFGVCMLGIVMKSKHKILGIVFIIFASIMFISLIPEDNWQRFKVLGTEADETGKERLELWKAGLRMAKEYPISGVGINNFPYFNVNFYNYSKPLVPHNIFIQILSETGFPGLILLLAIIIHCFYSHFILRKIFNQKKVKEPFLYSFTHGLDISLLGFIINGLTITVLYYPFFWTLLIMSSSVRQIIVQKVPALKNN